MSDIEYWEDRLRVHVEKLERQIDLAVQHQNTPDWDKSLCECQEGFRSIAGYKRAYQVELRLVKEPEARREYRDCLQKLDNRINLLQEDYEHLERASAKHEVSAKREVSSQAVNDCFLEDASIVQDLTQQSIVRIKANVQECKLTALTTLEDLLKQRETITTIDQETETVEHHVKRSEKLIQMFRKRFRGW